MKTILTKRAREILAETPMNTNININPGKKTNNSNKKVFVDKKTGDDILSCTHCDYDGKEGFIIINNDAAKEYRWLKCPECNGNLSAYQNIYCTKEEFESGSKGKNYSNPNYSATDNNKQGVINNFIEPGKQRADKEIMRSQNNTKSLFSQKISEAYNSLNKNDNKEEFEYSPPKKETNPETLEYKPANNFENASRYNPINKIKDTDLHGADNPKDGELWGGGWDRRYRDRDYEKHLDWTINKVNHYYPGWLDDYIKKIGGEVCSTPPDSHIMNLEEGQVRKEPVYPEFVTEKLLQDRHEYNKDYNYTKAHTVIMTKQAKKILDNIMDNNTIFYNGKNYIVVTKTAQKIIKDYLKKDDK